MVNKKNNSPNWEVVEFIGNSITPKSIKRLSDNKIFSIKDFVTNGTQMRGEIIDFELSFKNLDVFVKTTWSGVEMNLDSLTHIELLPSKYQIGQKVNIQGNEDKLTIIKAVHFYNDTTKYDIELFLNGGKQTRLYNISEDLLENV